MFQETGYRKKILILSNRIALSRQNKLHFLEFLSKLTNNSYFEKIAENLTETGLDGHFNFAFVTLCSYQQLYQVNVRNNEKSAINFQEFQYIILDECHFFTSDSAFNVHTDEILNYIVENGKNAIRIYMSSTIEDCFEPILRAEVKQNEEIFAKEKASLQEKFSPNAIEKFNIGLGIANGNYGYNNVSEFIDNRQQNIECEIERQRENLKMFVIFYHVSRNYYYIDNISEYLNLQDIFEVLLQKGGKSIVFVSKTLSDSEENELVKKFEEKNKKINFLSREKITNNAEAKKVYDKIIDEKKFDADVLVTTSLLDNGIDLKDEKLCNVVIDFLDKTEFLQMLGRVRVTSEQKISLYIPKCDETELKKMFEQKIQQLVTLLFMEILPVNHQQTFFEGLANNSWNGVYNKFRITKSDENFFEYNSCAIYQLVASSKNLLRMIKKNDPNYIINFNSADMMKRLNSVLRYYKNEGKGKAWSRAVVDLLETDEGLLERRKEIFKASKFTTPDRREKIEEDYAQKLGDDFLHFLQYLDSRLF